MVDGGVRAIDAVAVCDDDGDDDGWDCADPMGFVFKKSS